MMLADALRRVEKIRGWDWSGSRTRVGDFGWDYVDVAREHREGRGRCLDVGTGGGEVFSRIERPGDAALDISLERLAVARERLACHVVAGDQAALPFPDQSFDAVTDRHVGVPPPEVMRVLRPGGVYVAQHPGSHICQSIFDAFGWGSNGEFWRRVYAEEGRPFWNIAACARAYSEAGWTIARRDEAYVEQEFLDDESLAFWLLNAPLPEKVDPDKHKDVLATLDRKTNWHSELLVVERPPQGREQS